MIFDDQSGIALFGVFPLCAILLKELCIGRVVKTTMRADGDTVVRGDLREVVVLVPSCKSGNRTTKKACVETLGREILMEWVSLSFVLPMCKQAN